MAMLMDSQYECSDVDEVHIVLGPKSDLKVRMKSDEDLEDDPRAELFEGDIKPHVPGKFGKKGNVLCITMPIELRDRRFIVDSGSGHDLISLNRKCYFVHDIYIYIYIFVMRHVLRRASSDRERDIYIYTSSTAQGGGGSFKNRKPIGEVGCCESGMAERIH